MESVEDMPMNIRENMEQRELELLSPYAAHSGHSPHTPDQAAMAPEHGTLVSPKMTAGKIGSVITANITAMEEVFQRSSTSQIPI